MKELRHRVTRVVDEHIHSAPFASPDDVLDGVRVRHVLNDDVRPNAITLREILRSLFKEILSARDEDDVVTLLRQLLGEARADSSARARAERERVSIGR